MWGLWWNRYCLRLKHNTFSNIISSFIFRSVWYTKRTIWWQEITLCSCPTDEEAHNLINDARYHENFTFLTISHCCPSSVSCLLQHTVKQNTIVCFILTLESQLINCCLLYCEIVLWLFNWASVCYYGLPNVEYYLRNTLHWNTFFLFHHSLGRRETCFSKRQNHLFLYSNLRISFRSSRFDKLFHIFGVIKLQCQESNNYCNVSWLGTISTNCTQNLEKIHF